MNKQKLQIIESRQQQNEHKWRDGWMSSEVCVWFEVQWVAWHAMPRSEERVILCMCVSSCGMMVIYLSVHRCRCVVCRSYICHGVYIWHKESKKKEQVKFKIISTW
jgi:hypothetical protein